MKPIIRVESLSKRYRIGARHQSYGTLRERIAAMVRMPLDRLSQNGKATNDVIWALKDVSFEVQQGETIGIIGRNGAGKSTLLKILSRITEPTSGRAMIWGRIASLLEVGTGFHPELTGRENIYLNGAILGMTRRDIQQKFDEIVAFAEIEKFIDTPVKRYSSGMYVRLAFAVAAHLEPDILVIDEVLAVGDAAFQNKCLGKLGDVASHGRTVLFVSHNIPAVQKLCKTAYLIEEGKIVSGGDAANVAEAYYQSFGNRDTQLVEIREVPEGIVRYTKWHIKDSGERHSCYTGEPSTIQLQLVVGRTVAEANFGIAIWAADGTLVWAMRNLDYGGDCVVLKEGVYEIQYKLPILPLRPGNYQIHVSANDLKEGTLDSWYAKPKLTILAKDDSGLPVQWQGVLNIPGEFKFTFLGIGTSTS
jgi:ABC-type polysaccharide/polyol phosphate transport system, ATPase component